jgi:hypothetical protein
LGEQAVHLAETENPIRSISARPPVRLRRKILERVAGFINQLDRGLVRLVLLLRWKRESGAAEERIRAFEATEDDSAWQLLHACTRIADPSVKARLFLQAMEEAHHAEVFRGLYEESSGKKLRKLQVVRKPIFQPEAPWKLFAYCAVGEAAAASRFRHIAEALPPGRFREALQKILAEEEGHIGLAEALVSLSGRTAGEVNAEIARIRLVRAWESWLRFGRGLSGLVSRGLLNASYFLMGWWLRPKEEK